MITFLKIQNYDIWHRQSNWRKIVMDLQIVTGVIDSRYDKQFVSDVNTYGLRAAYKSLVNMVEYHFKGRETPEQVQKDLITLSNTVNEVCDKLK